ncbi:MAG: tRNA (N(6)-L-threonylcarbamoyladenosine(37)-C(2))-methylthiotransferase MtaB [Veillonellaceae bacterium]|nr:tRNA (N(6)-L-threonylcarbamoyladenosine(37)-C(2))-methylthiotransferase MtaB [Veillonellaceae bacterium]
MKRVAFTTLGCRVNQYDTDAMKGLFIKNGYTVTDFDKEADIYVINTCSVTHMGEKKSRQLIRQAKRHNPQSHIVVTGCYAQLDPDTIAAIDGVSLVVGMNDRHRVVELVEQLSSTERQIRMVRDIMKEHQFEEMPLMGDESGKARAFMKIQEGCNNYCAFCIIPYTRGQLKSRQLRDIVKEAKRLTDHDYHEIVLTGIHLGNYGVDLAEPLQLADVARALLDNPDIYRIRFGSIESVEVSDELIDLIAKEPRMCKHLHLPMQAGSDAVLKAMNRHYDLATYKALIKNLRGRIPGLTITTDIIAGFPGETDANFDETVATVKELGFAHIHAFPYSIRKGTPAADMDNQVPEAIKKARVGVLNQLGREGWQKKAQSMLGTKVTILVEQDVDGWYQGFTDDYIHGKIKADGVHTYPIGSLVKGYVKSIDREDLVISIDSGIQ